MARTPADLALMLLGARMEAKLPPKSIARLVFESKFSFRRRDRLIAEGRLNAKLAAAAMPTKQD